MGGSGGLERTNFKVSSLGGCDGPEKTDSLQFLIWDGLMVLKELIFNSFLLWENSFLTVSTLGGCGGLERTNFNSFHLGWVWWS